MIPSHRDRGIGAKLISEAERQARDLGHVAIVLGVEVNNEAAHRLYERLGYREWPHGEMRDAYTWTDDAGQEHEQEEVVIWMEKRLDVEECH